MSYSLGEFGRLHPTPIFGWNVDTLDFLPATVDATGALITAGGGGGGGTVDQGTGGSSAWKVDGSAVTQPVSGTVAVSGSVAVTGSFYQATQPVSGSFYQTTQPVSIATMPSTPVTGTFFQATQPVSLATAPTTPVTGTFFQATQPVSIATMPSTPVTGTFYQVTQPVSLASAPSTPITNVNLDAALSTLATSSAQGTGNGSLASIATNTGLGATAAAQSTGNGSLATIATNTGLAATAGKQDTGNTSLASLDGKAPALGQALAASSVPVVLPALTVTALTPPAAITGFALDSSLTTGNASLATIATNTGLGATASAQTTGNSALATLVTQTAPLLTAQGADGTSVAGPLVQALVNDTPNSYSVGAVQPLSLTAEGRLRVSTIPSDINQIWQDIWTVNPWADDADASFPSVTQSALASAGAA